MVVAHCDFSDSHVPSVHAGTHFMETSSNIFSAKVSAVFAPRNVQVLLLYKRMVTVQHCCHLLNEKGITEDKDGSKINHFI